MRVQVLSGILDFCGETKRRASSNIPPNVQYYLYLCLVHGDFRPLWIFYETMKVTRILKCRTDKGSLFRLNSMADSLSLLRSEIWRRYGALQNVGKSRFELTKAPNTLISIGGV